MLLVLYNASLQVAWEPRVASEGTVDCPWSKILLPSGIAKVSSTMLQSNICTSAGCLLDKTEGTPNMKVGSEPLDW